MTVGCRRSWSYIYLLFVLFCAVFFQTGHSANFRPKRSLIQFSNMIRIATNNEDPMRFNNYGHHCGTGSQPFRPPVDKIDACCKQHDLCYASYGYRTTSSCYSGYYWPYSPYYSNYNWILQHGNIMCVDFDNYCKRSICNCDRQAAQCLAQHSFRYNNAYKQSNFLTRIAENILSRTQKFLNWFF